MATTTSSQSPDLSRMQATMGEIGFLSRSAMSESRHDFINFPQQFKLENLVRAATRVGTDAFRFAVHAEGATVTLRREITDKYLREFLARSRYVLFQVQEDVLMTAYERSLQIDAANNGTGDHPGNRFKVLVAIAVGALFSSQTHRSIAYAEQLLEAGMKDLDEVLRSGDNTAIVDCLLYLILYSMHSMAVETTWHLLGFAMRLAISAGLHKVSDDSNEDVESTVSHLQALFGSLYCLDRSAVLDGL